MLAGVEAGGLDDIGKAGVRLCPQPPLRTQVQRVAKPGSGEATITTSSSFAASCSNPVTCNQPLTTTDARGNFTDYSYDPNHGGLIMATGPAPSAGAVRPQTRYGYANIGGILRLSEISACQTLTGGTPPIPLINDPGTPAACDGTADEVVTTLGYDANGNVTSVASGAGDGSLTATITSSYDAMGNLITIDGPLAGAADTTRLRYNASRELVGTVSADPDGAGPLPHRAVRNIIDGQGRVTRVDIGTVASQSDADWAGMAVHQSTEIDYDAQARPVVERLTSGGTTYALSQLSYDAIGRPECVAQRMNPAAFGALPASACTLGTEGTFGPDRIARTIYDAAGQVSQVQTAYGTPDQANEVSATYTANGLVQTLTDGAGNRTTFVHDGHDRLSRTRYPMPTVGANTSSTTDYEEVGYDAASNVVSFCNRAGQLTTFTHDALGRMTSVNRPGAEPDATYAYDLLGRMTSASQPGHALSFTYDALGRPLTEAGPQGTVSSSWDVAGRRTRVTYPGGGLYVDYDYLVTGEMTRVRENGATSGIGLLATYGYDSLGRRTSLTRGNGTATTYGYDAVSRLTSLGQNLAGATNDLTLGFTYNPAGEIVGTTRSNDAYAFTGLANGSQSLAVNGLNQVTAINGTATAHDANGNMTNDGVGTYGYRSDNALISASGGVTLGYDPSGRLHHVASGAGTTRFMHDGINLVAEYDGANQLQRRFVHGDGIDEPLVEYVGAGTSNRRFLHADERGSVIGQTDNAGAIAAINRYDEYGVPQSGNIGRFQYTGLPWLTEVGLQYSRARMMNPGLGRFMQPDPIGYGDGMSLYAYVAGDPVNQVDPFGLWQQAEPPTPEEEIFVIGRRIRLTCPGGWVAVGGGWLCTDLTDYMRAVLPMSAVLSLFYHAYLFVSWVATDEQCSAQEVSHELNLHRFPGQNHEIFGRGITNTYAGGPYGTRFPITTFSPAPGVYTNATRPGHLFHGVARPGSVTRFTYNQDGWLGIVTYGSGTNYPPFGFINDLAGPKMFSVEDNKIRRHLESSC